MKKLGKKAKVKETIEAYMPMYLCTCNSCISKISLIEDRAYISTI